MAKYPTKKEILKKSPKYSEETIQAMLKWKKAVMKDWNKINKVEKILCLEFLVLMLSSTNKLPIPRVYWDTRIGIEYAYKPSTQTIYLDARNPSIISTLHEFAHHMRGSSELKACRWSIHLFKEIFPESYKKLKWKGHMLIKK